MEATILLIDDDMRILETFARTLRLAGYNVLTAGGGDKGLALYHQEAPDVILLDLQMPGTDGLEVLRAIRQDDPEANVILFTGYNDQDAVIAALRAGASDLLSKPIAQTALESALRRAEERIHLKRELRASQEALRQQNERLEEDVRARTVELEREIEERKEAERALRESEIRLRAIGDNLPTGLIFQLRVEPDGTNRFIYVSAAVERLHECTAEEAIADPSLLFDRVVEEDREGLALATEKSIREMSVYDHEVRIRRKSGEIRWHRMTSKPRRTEDGAVLFDGIDIDITDQKQAEEALRQSAERLETQNTELNAYAHTVAHDLKNPLALVIGYAKFAEQEVDTASPAELRSVIQRILHSGQRLDRIVDELLLMASVRKQDVSLTPLKMGDVVHEVCERMHLAIEEAQVEIVAPDPSTWPVVLGYAPWVEEVWANYISNALKYGGEPPRVELGWDTSADDASLVRFWVRDNGPGLTPEAQSKLFSPFTQLAQVRLGGYGLGLSIVRRIMDKLGGEVGVESTPGEGSSFWFTLRSAGFKPTHR
jgi:PAS domain S-box-containing protein